MGAGLLGVTSLVSAGYHKNVEAKEQYQVSVTQQIEALRADNIPQREQVRELSAKYDALASQIATKAEVEVQRQQIQALQTQVKALKAHTEAVRKTADTALVSGAKAGEAAQAAAAVAKAAETTAKAASQAAEQASKPAPAPIAAAPAPTPPAPSQPAIAAAPAPTPPPASAPKRQPAPAPQPVAPVTAKGKHPQCEQLRPIIAKYGDWDLKTMLAISMAESGCRTAAVNGKNRNGSVDRCHFQVNSIHIAKVPGRDLARLHDPHVCTDVAHQIFKGQGLNAWVVYKTGAFRKYLNDF